MAFERPLTRDEPLVRFIYSSKQVSRSSGRVKPDAFLPDPRHQPFRTSVFRILGLAVAEVRDLGAKVGASRNRELHVCATLAVSVVAGAGLEVDPNDDPPRHADIIGWADDKPARLAQAVRLAADAALLE